MELHLIVSVMRRNKVGAMLIAVQTAITLAVLCNGLFILQQRLALSNRPTGADEVNIFTIANRAVGDLSQLPGELRTDLSLLRALPGVVDAYATNAYPLGNSGWSNIIALNDDREQHLRITSASYFADEHTIDALGLKLIAGRNFKIDEVVDRERWLRMRPPGIVITKALAEALFPQGNALDKSVFLQGERQMAPIIGIVDRLQAPWTSVAREKLIDNSILEPYRLISPTSFYVVRAKPGLLAGVMRAAESALIRVDPTRIIEKMQSLSVARAEAYRDDRGLAIILTVICSVLLAATICGIAGLTSYWVAQLRRQIGIRRALGATRAIIFYYFQTENFLLVSVGTVVGLALAITLNMWMVSRFQMTHLQYSYAVVSGVIVLLLGQLAVLWPALQAATISPGIATRGMDRTSPLAFFNMKS
jgi:putative ABC transport system permease protein